MALDPQENKKQIITLCMIVKDEAQVITRALDSVKSIVDHIFICDTGSSDSTKEVINLYLTENKIAGKVVSCAWKNFGHNRTECFTLGKEAYPDTDYLMTLDADEVIVPWKDVPLKNKHITALPLLEGDTLYVKTCLGGMDYYRSAFFKASLPWKWIGVLHEYPYCEIAKSANRIAHICNLPSQDGARSKNPNKYLDDAKLFEEDLKNDPENSRSWFYLAQSYVDGGQPKKAIVPIKNAAKYASWDEEVFVSLLRIARYKRFAGAKFEEVLGDYLAAYEYAPHRVEPLYDIIHYYRSKDNFNAASIFLEKALGISYPKDCILFVESSIYEWQLQDEASLVHYYTGKPHIAIAMVKLILEKDSIPPQARERIENNLKLYMEAASKPSCCAKPKKSIVL